MARTTGQSASRIDRTIYMLISDMSVIDKALTATNDPSSSLQATPRDIARAGHQREILTRSRSCCYQTQAFGRPESVLSCRNLLLKALMRCATPQCRTKLNTPT